MAHEEDNHPVNHIIVFFMVASGVVLLAAHFLLTSYYYEVSGEELQDKIATLPATAYDNLRREQLEKLRTGAVPIAEAMRQLADEGREGVPLVAPQRSEDQAARAGWMHHPDFVAVDPAPAAAPPVAGETVAAPAAEGAPAAAPARAAAAASPTPVNVP